VKRAIDRDRRPGRFLLTGSANLLLMRQVSESLAGRASYLTLWPMTRREQLGQGPRWALGGPAGAPDAEWRDLLAAGDEGARRTGGARAARRFPTPALELATPPSAPSGSTATCAPISNATCRTSPRSARCRTSAA
jgi:uncharacterized protein